MKKVIAVSNSGPLISLSAIHHLQLLECLFETVCIPHAVFREVVLFGKNRPGCSEVKEAEWIRTIEIRSSVPADLLQDRLDPGEAETILLANELNADYVILDEQLARRKAIRIGLPVIGTLGILLMAKKSGYIDIVLERITKLEEASFRISRGIKEVVLKKAGECFSDLS